MRPFQTSVLLVLALSTTASVLAAVFVHRRLDLASLLSSQSGTDKRQPVGISASVSRQLSPVDDEKRTREPSTPSVLTFDALQISPDGTSVFAGRAPPRSHVTVSANQRPIATATANEDGEWVVVIHEKIGTGEVQFSLTARLHQRWPAHIWSDRAENRCSRFTQRGGARQLRPVSLASGAPKTDHLRLRSSGLHDRGSSGRGAVGRLPKIPPAADGYSERPC